MTKGQKAAAARAARAAPYSPAKEGAFDLVGYLNQR